MHTKKRWLARLALAAGLAIGGLSACGAGKVGEVVRPPDMTATEALGHDQEPPGCRDVAEYAEPLVVDWPTQKRLDLELAMQGGVAVVSYDCHRFELLKDCKVAGSYRFAGVSRKEEVIQLETRDELQANLPLGGVKLSAGMDRGASIDLALVLVGKQSTTVTPPPRTALEGSQCQRATHIVRAATIGAFSIDKGSAGKVRAVADFFDAGVQGKSSSERASQTRDGSLPACRKSNPDDAQPPAQCRAAVRVELLPIPAKSDGKESKKEGGLQPKKNPCPEGMVLTSGKCTDEDQKDPFLCAKDDLQGCKTQCDGGHADSCFNYAALLLRTARSEEDVLTIIAASEKACDGDNLMGCHAAGFLLRKCKVRGKGETCVRRNPERAKKLLTKACDGGLGRSCSKLASDLEFSTDSAQHASRVEQLYQRSCKLGEAFGCWDLAKLYLRGTLIPRDVVKGIQVLRQACDDGHRIACSELADIYIEGNYITRNPARAAGYLEIACKDGRPYDCGRLGELLDKGHPGLKQDVPRARSLFKQACFLSETLPRHFTPHTHGCARLGEMFEKGIGGKTHKGNAARAYALSCQGGLGCGEAARLMGEQAVEMLAKGCQSSMHSKLCDELEKRDRARARKLYESKCDGNQANQACIRLAKLAPG